jgi:hypothetical protein
MVAKFWASGGGLAANCKTDKGRNRDLISKGHSMRCRTDGSGDLVRLTAWKQGFMRVVGIDLDGRMSCLWTRDVRRKRFEVAVGKGFAH